MDAVRQKKIFLAVLGGLVAVFLLVVCVVLALGPSSGNGDRDSSSGVPDDEILVSDLYSGEMLIPKYDLPKNEYSKAKFREKNGYLQYDEFSARLGVDVSEYQGDIDWEAVEAAGMDFAFVRLGFRGATRGLLNVDAKFEQNLQQATDAGLFVGVYFFSQAITEAEAEAEAEFVIETLNGRKLAYPVVFDWEPPSNSGAENYRTTDVEGQQVTKFARAFCEKIKEAGYKPCVYTNKYMAYEFFNLEELKDYDLWYAEYQLTPSLYYDFRIWQYTETGSVPGIDGNVDIDICFRPY